VTLKIGIAQQIPAKYIQQKLDFDKCNVRITQNLNLYSNDNNLMEEETNLMNYDRLSARNMTHNEIWSSAAFDDCEMETMRGDQHHPKPV